MWEKDKDDLEKFAKFLEYKRLKLDRSVWFRLERNGKIMFAPYRTPSKWL